MLIAHIVRFGQVTTEELLALYIMSRIFILIGQSLQNVLGKLQGSTFDALALEIAEAKERRYLLMPMHQYI